MSNVSSSSLSGEAIEQQEKGKVKGEENFPMRKSEQISKRTKPRRSYYQYRLNNYYHEIPAIGTSRVTRLPLIFLSVIVMSIKQRAYT